MRDRSIFSFARHSPLQQGAGRIVQRPADSVPSRRMKMSVLLVSLCFMIANVKAHPADKPPLPQKLPVQCGRPGRCSEVAGLKDPDELHEVRTTASHPITRPHEHISKHGLCVHAHGARTFAARCAAARTSSSILCPGDPVGVAALCVESQMRAGRARIGARGG